MGLFCSIFEFYDNAFKLKKSKKDNAFLRCPFNFKKIFGYKMDYMPFYFVFKMFDYMIYYKKTLKIFERCNIMYEKIVLKNGVRIVTEKIDYVHSVSIGIWVGNGSRYEPKELNGISHFIEHMIFKGTKTRCAKDIAIKTDELGGQFNAFTTKECTCYYAKLLNTHLKEGIEVLADMFLNSVFKQEDIDTERGVILEEIGMYEDSPEDVATEKLIENCFENNGLGMPILGTQQTLKNINTQSIKDYLKNFYKPNDIVVAISGMFKKEDLDFICDLFSSITGNGKNEIEKAIYIPKSKTYRKTIEQNHICIGFEGLPVTSNKRYALQILASALGGGMSSRLFQTVREKHGLCYYVYAYNTIYKNTGMVSICTAVNSETEKKAISLIKEEIEKLCCHGICQDELERCREQIKINILMGLENTSQRMHQIGRSELNFDRVITPNETIKFYDAVKKEDILQLARDIFKFDNVAITAVGQVSDENYYLSMIK